MYTEIIPEIKLIQIAIKIFLLNKVDLQNKTICFNFKRIVVSDNSLIDRLDRNTNDENY